MNLNILKNAEFENKLTNVKKRLKIYLEEKKYNLTNITTDELVQWKDEADGRRVFPHNNCPNDILGIITEYIKDEFK